MRLTVLSLMVLLGCRPDAEASEPVVRCSVTFGGFDGQPELVEGNRWLSVRSLHFVPDGSGFYQEQLTTWPDGALPPDCADCPVTVSTEYWELRWWGPISAPDFEIPGPRAREWRCEVHGEWSFTCLETDRDSGEERQVLFRENCSAAISPSEGG